MQTFLSGTDDLGKVFWAKESPLRLLRHIQLDKKKLLKI